MKIKNTLLDNSSERLMMVNVIGDLIGDNGCDKVLIATGYWDIPGTHLLLPKLKDFFGRGGELQLLIGTDPIVRQKQLKNPEMKDASFPQDFIRRDLQDLEVKDEWVETLQMLRENCKENEDESQLKIRIYKKDEKGDAQFFHAKCYIFLGQDYAYGIIGSSNLTQKGLEGNSELNYLETNDTVVMARPDDKGYSNTKGHEMWFNEKWDISTPWNKEFLEELMKSPAGKKTAKPKEKKIAPLTPYELYIRLLSERFGNIVDADQHKRIESYLPKGFSPLSYQIDAVKQCEAIMQEHGGFMLGDVVGLGKTVVGTLLIKEFLTNMTTEGRPGKVLIVAPPAIMGSWRETIQIFDEQESDENAKMESHVKIRSTGRLQTAMAGIGVSEDIEIEEEDEDDVVEEEEVEGGEGEATEEVDEEKDGEAQDAPKETWDTIDKLRKTLYNTFDGLDFGLIIVDESHKLRNADTNIHNILDQLIGYITTHTGLTPYVGLLSATPQNNRPRDLANQIYLFERNNTNSTLKKAANGNLHHYFSEKDREYRCLITPKKNNMGMMETLTPEEAKKRNEALRNLSADIREKVLDDIMVRRTRTDVAKYYAADIEAQGLRFPNLGDPVEMRYAMDHSLATLFRRTLTTIAPRDKKELFDTGIVPLMYYRYSAITFLTDPENRGLYEFRNQTAEVVAHRLKNLMRNQLVKRLESSFDAFRKSLSNIRTSTENMIRMWQDDCIFICPDLDINAELDVKAKREKRDKPDLTIEDCYNDIRKKIKKMPSDKRKKNREFKRKDFDPSYIDMLLCDKRVMNNLIDAWRHVTEDPKKEVFKEYLGDMLSKKTNPEQKLVVFTESTQTTSVVNAAIREERPDLRNRILVITADNREEKRGTIAANFDANFRGEKCDKYDVIITTDTLAEGVNLHRANVIVNYDSPWNATRLMQRIGRVNRIGSAADKVYVYNFMPSDEGDNAIDIVNRSHGKLQTFHFLFGEDSKIFTSGEEVEHFDLHIPEDEGESPMERYIGELRSYKKSHAERYAQVVAATDNLETATPEADGQSGLFMIRKGSHATYFVRAAIGKKPRILQPTEMFDAFRTDEQTPCAPLPPDWDERRERALMRVRQVAAQTQSIKETANIKAAKDIALNLKQKFESKETKKLIDDAYGLIDEGDNDLANTIVTLNAKMKENGKVLIDMTEQEFYDILGKAMKTAVEHAKEEDGEPVVVLALDK